MGQRDKSGVPLSASDNAGVITFLVSQCAAQNSLSKTWAAFAHCWAKNRTWGGRGRSLVMLPCSAAPALCLGQAGTSSGQGICLSPPLPRTPSYSQRGHLERPLWHPAAACACTLPSLPPHRQHSHVASRPVLPGEHSLLLHQHLPESPDLLPGLLFRVPAWVQGG